MINLQIEREMIRPGNISCRTFMEIREVWDVASSCWIHIFQIIKLCISGTSSELLILCFQALWCYASEEHNTYVLNVTHYSMMLRHWNWWWNLRCVSVLELFCENRSTQTTHFWIVQRYIVDCNWLWTKLPTFLSSLKTGRHSKFKINYITSVWNVSKLSVGPVI